MRFGRPARYRVVEARSKTRHRVARPPQLRAARDDVPRPRGAHVLRIVARFDRNRGATARNDRRRPRGTAFVIAFTSAAAATTSARAFERSVAGAFRT